MVSVPKAAFQKRFVIIYKRTAVRPPKKMSGQREELLALRNMTWHNGKMGSSPPKFKYDEYIRSEDYLTATYPEYPLLGVLPDAISSKKSRGYARIAGFVYNGSDESNASYYKKRGYYGHYGYYK